MKKANPTVIGSFVLVGVALIIGAVLLFSSPTLFAQKEYYSMYFQQNINGLNVGAPVKFLGIQIGSVVKIGGVFNGNTGEMTPRIVVEVIPDTVIDRDLGTLAEQRALLERLVDRGVRAKLQAQSLLTGQLYVSMEFHPDMPVRYLAAEDEEFMEVPTLDSGLDEALASLSSVLSNADKAMATIADLLTSPEFQTATGRFDNLIIDMDKLMVSADDLAKDADVYLNQDLRAATNELQRTLASARKDFHDVSGKVSQETLVKVNQALTDIQALVENVNSRIDREDPLNYEIIKTMRDLQSAARTIKGLAAYLEQHPEALLKGKNLQ
jgi:paraquat-inducible protein B